MALINNFLKPVVPPQEAYRGSSDVAAWRQLNGGEAVLEVFQRDNGLFGYRFQAWVAWRDAANEVRSHSWYQIDLKSALITDRRAEEISLADKSALELGASFSGEWNENAP